MNFKYFSTKELYSYIYKILESKEKLNKTENEILAALTILVAYHEEYNPATYFFGFPIKNNLSEKEIKNIPSNFENVLRYLEDYSIEDIRIIIKEKIGNTYILPLQLKRLDFKKINSTKKLIAYLEKIKEYSKSKTRLIIIYEDIITPQTRKNGKYKISLIELEKWFKKNDFPFQEIIFTCFKNNREKEIIFYQFWPLMNTQAREKKFKIKAIIEFIKNN